MRLCVGLMPRKGKTVQMLGVQKADTALVPAPEAAGIRVTARLWAWAGAACPDIEFHRRRVERGVQDRLGFQWVQLCAEIDSAICACHGERRLCGLWAEACLYSYAGYAR